MRLRDFLLAACLVSWLLPGPGLAQQAASSPEVVVPPEPHPEPHPAQNAVPAGPAVYNVEVIVFRTNAALGSPENWAAEASQAPVIPEAADGETGAAGDAGTGGSVVQPGGSRFVRALTPAEFQLGDIEARLRSSGTYVPVAHVGWAQTASAWGSKESMSLRQLGFDDPQLSGTVTLERGQFLHLGFALSLAIANPPSGLAAAPNTTFVLNDNHRVKFYERNLFDAPAFSVIALVGPAQGTRRAGR